MALQIFLFFLIGFLISIPVGPVGILVVLNALQGGVKRGFFVGLGASISDTLYALILLLNVSPILTFFRVYEAPITFLGILILFYLSFKSFTFRSREKENRSFSSRADGLASFFINVSNPAVLLSFSYLFLIFRMERFLLSRKVTIVALLAFFLGSLLWWFVLSSIARSFQKKVKRDMMTLMYQFSGALLLIFAIVMSFYFVWKFFVSPLI